MTISYKWLLDYLPVTLSPEEVASILNSIGLEVEKMEAYQEVKGGMKGLVLGEVIEVEKHPNADKLSITKVHIGGDSPLSIVCGAPNVAAGQKVIVAPVGVTIYPTTGEPLTMRVAKIRGVESQGMICAEDEIGLGTSHDGIMVLDPSIVPGTSAIDYFQPYEDVVFEIGLTPNRSDAMSHLGVARDICAYLSHHRKQVLTVKTPYPTEEWKTADSSRTIKIDVQDTTACPRYSGVTISGVNIGPSPKWLVERLKAIGVRPINNIVDITNYVLHETGQPLHAFDATKIEGNTIIVKKLSTKSTFRSLDDKERQLHADDLMICDGNGTPMCMAGVFGGKNSGVSDQTSEIFLESALFEGGMIRKSSFRHHLRTDAATHFEKGIDIGNTVNVLKRAAWLIVDIAGGKITSPIQDIYPKPVQPKMVSTSYSFLHKLSGKAYEPQTVQTILTALGFMIIDSNEDTFTVQVPLHKTDVTMPADLAEEVMRIDGFDNIEIPASIMITPSTEENHLAPLVKEKISNILAGMGFQEILNNSITNSAFLTEAEAATAVKMMNNLSAELDSLRVSMLETGLQTVVHNLNHKNQHLRLFEFGKTYSTTGAGNYTEVEHLALFLTGKTRIENWHYKKEQSDIYHLKGTLQALCAQMGITQLHFQETNHPKLSEHLTIYSGETLLGSIGKVNHMMAERFDCKADVYVADILWENALTLASNVDIRYKEISRFPAVQRDLAFLVDRYLAYNKVEETVLANRLPKLRQVSLFDVFESDKLGAGKKSMALSFTFLDEEKTLTDKEIDDMMNKIIVSLEKELNAEIRKN